MSLPPFAWRSPLIFVVDALLLIFESCRFAGSQLAALDALRDAVLLILAALADFAVAVLRGIGVVLVVVDLVRQVILLIVQLGAVGGGQMAVVFRAHRVLFLVDARFLGFQVLRFTSGELVAVNSLRDAVLLIVLALRDGLRRRLLQWSWCWLLAQMRTAHTEQSRPPHSK